MFIVEFDERFNVFPEFVYYDFHKPFGLPRKTTTITLKKKTKNWHIKAKLKGSIDHIICDPPFLSEDCQTKGKMTHKHFPSLQKINISQAYLNLLKQQQWQSDGYPKPGVTQTQNLDQKQ